jgi:hypothetical protein
MADKKLKDTPLKKVRVVYRDQENESQGVRVGTNNVIENGKRVLKQYRIQIDKEVELPVTVVELLKAKYVLRKDKQGNDIKVPLLIVEEV